jgi:hypothetical protein
MGEQMADMNIRMDTALALLESLAQRQDAHGQAITQLEAQKRLSPAHKRDVQEQITRIVETTKHQAIPLRYSHVYGRIKHRFRVGSYLELPDQQFDELMQFLRDELARATNGELPEQGSMF